MRRLALLLSLVALPVFAQQDISKVEVAASTPTAEFDAVWGKGFLQPDRFVEMLYKNLQQRAQ